MYSAASSGKTFDTCFPSQSAAWGQDMRQPFSLSKRHTARRTIQADCRPIYATSVNHE